MSKTTQQATIPAPLVVSELFDRALETDFGAELPKALVPSEYETASKHLLDL
ncbi:MAG: hypothetical protein R3F61_34075 [Myxococcota bacterium]